MQRPVNVTVISFRPYQFLERVSPHPWIVVSGHVAPPKLPSSSGSTDKKILFFEFLYRRGYEIRIDKCEQVVKDNEILISDKFGSWIRSIFFFMNYDLIIFCNPSKFVPSSNNHFPPNRIRGQVIKIITQDYPAGLPL